MASSYLNIVTFLLTTLFYYLAIKPSFTYEISIDPKKHKEYISSNYMYLAIYLLLVMVIQFMVNASIISSTCGGNIKENIGAAGVLTFLPWTLIFGVIIVILTVYPGFKSAFSDVIGYFWVSSSKRIRSSSCSCKSLNSEFGIILLAHYQNQPIPFHQFQ